MQTNDLYPDFTAKFYDIIYDKILSNADKEFYLKKIAETKGPVLELGVGTGRLFIEALKGGADIYGVDISQNMINQLKEKLDPQNYYRVEVQDIIHMKLNKKFNMIIAPFRVFSHIINTQDQINTLNNVYDHLNSGGYLIFDLYIPNLKMLSEGLTNHMDFQGEYKPGNKISRITSMKADLINQISNVKMEYIWEENGEEKKMEWIFPMRYYFRFELEHLISLSELGLENIFGDFEENELNPDSKEFIVVCRKHKEI